MDPAEPVTEPDDAGVAETLGGTKATDRRGGARDAEDEGIRWASAREIAKAGRFNQALIFYHFGSVQNAAAGGA